MRSQDGRPCEANSLSLRSGKQRCFDASELSDPARVNLLPLPARNERGEGWGEGKSERECPSSPRPSPPAAGGEGESCALSAVLFLNSTAVVPEPGSLG